MMKKEIRYISMFVALAAIAFTGCSRFEEEDLFDESAALRIEHNSQKLQDILVDEHNAPFFSCLSCSEAASITSTTTAIGAQF